MVRISLTKVLLFVLFIVLLMIANFHINYSNVGNVKSNVRKPLTATTRPSPPPSPKVPGILEQEKKIKASGASSGTEQISALRKQTLADACVANSITNPDNLFHFDLARESGLFNGLKPRLLVSDQHKAMYCAIGRTGSENWERIIERMEMGHGKEEGQLDERFVGAPTLREIWDYRDQSIRYRMENYYKFLFVREPLTRLLSAYKRFVVDESDQDLFSNQFRSWFGARKGNISKLESFVDFVLSEWTTRPEDLEWGSYNNLCAPCFVNYNFIGRYETIHEDAEHVFSETDVKQIQYSDPHKEHFEQDFLQELRNAIPTYKLDQLFEKYKLDYSLFGYPQP